MSNVKIGLEVHGYLMTKEKLFCQCPTNYKTARLNTNICPICCGCPGSKPMLPNFEALKKAIKISLMLGCKINSGIIWQRKHYDWPDLPKGYQDTTSGAYSVPVGESGEYLGIRIHHTHLEEDPARWDPETGNVDYNRCGMPLIEIVTEPDFKTSQQAREWLNQILTALSYIKAVDADAGIKADVNVSVNVNGKQGERVEVKNINSVYSIGKAIDYEISRQSSLLMSGEKVKRETRAFAENKTVMMREKEAAEDYRFIPDPDLVIMDINKELIDELKKNLPELPHLKIERFVKKHKLDEKAAKVLSQNKELADFFEKIAEKADPGLAAYWVTIELLRVLNWNKKELNEVDIKPEHFIELLQMIEKKEVTELAAKQILNEFVPKSFSPLKKLKSSERIDSRDEIEKVCAKVIEKNKQAVEDYKKGEQKAIFFLMGEVMKATQKRADSKITIEILKKLLK